MPTSRRHIALVRYAITVVVVLVLAASWSTRFDTLARDQVDAGLKRALITFASARSILTIRVREKSCFTSVVRRPNAEVVPGLRGITRSGICISAQRRLACNGPAPPKATIINVRGS